MGHELHQLVQMLLRTLTLIKKEPKSGDLQLFPISPAPFTLNFEVYKAKDQHQSWPQL